MKSKICIICGKEFIPNSANQKCCCKECSEENKKIYYQNNKEIYLQRNKKYRENKPKKIAICIICGKEFIKINNSKCCSDECRITHSKQQKYEYNKKYLPERYKTNALFRLSVISRVNLRRCLLLSNNTQKKDKTFNIFGYTPNDLKEHLEKQFRNGMTWDNMGTLWEIDHIKEIDSFNFILPNGETDYEQIKIANSLSNLQPLLKDEHLIKSKNYIKTKQ